MKTLAFLLQLSLLFALPQCKKSSNTVTIDPVPPDGSFFAKGADVSWVTEMEGANVKFYNSTGTQQECMHLMKSLGVNAIRLRVWVNPTNGYNNTADVLAKALRAKNLGLKLMIDFHFSDTWADPGHQTSPLAWSGFTIADLKTAVYDHTFIVMTTLKNNSIIPEWVQVGNETNDGFLWRNGKASTNMANYASFFKAGYDAVKAVSPASKVMVHLSNGYDNSLFRWNLEGLKSNGATWDVIGMSLYPSASNWSALNTQCLANMNDMITRFGSEIMVCEVGMSWDQPIESNAFLSDIISKVKSLNNKKGLGVFYWEPEAYNNWQGYPLGAFDNTGKPTAALNAFN